MMAKQTYTDEQFRDAVKSSHRMIEVLRKLGVKPKSSSYNLANKLVVDLNLDISHFSKNKTFSAIKYTEEQFRDAVKNSFTMIDVLRTIGVRGSGGNYDIAHRMIKKMGLDTSHFTGHGHLKGKHHTWSKAHSLDKILVNGYNGGIPTSKLKNKLFRANMLENKCSKCGIKDWNGLPLSLELEHINGDRYDNRIDNLTILCPNCHSQTHTFRRKKSSLCNLHSADNKI